MSDEKENSGTAPEKTHEPSVDAKQKRGFAFRNQISLIISISAFLISASSTYYSSFRVEDHVSLLFPSPPIAVWDTDNYLSAPSSVGNAIFINSGTRASVIIWFQLFYLQHGGTNQRSCSTGLYPDDATFLTDLEPMVLKEKDARTNKINILDTTYYMNVKKRPDGRFSFPVDSRMTGMQKIDIDVCAIVRIATPSTAVHDAIVPINKYSVSRGSVFA
jgi:hypothetical protein